MKTIYFILKFKLYLVALLSAIIAGGVRFAYMKRQQKQPTWTDTFYYVVMTGVITGICALVINYLNLPVNDKTLYGYGCIFVLIGQFTDMIYLKAGIALGNKLDKYVDKRK